MAEVVVANQDDDGEKYEAHKQSAADRKKSKKSKRPGVPCPSCKAAFSRVVRTDEARAAVVSRLRSCIACGCRFVTRETRSDTGVLSLLKALDSTRALSTPAAILTAGDPHATDSRPH